MVNGVGGPSPLRMPEEIPSSARAASNTGAAGENFGATMKEFLGSVNDLQLQSDQIFRAFVRGEVRDLHQVALAQQEAGIAVRLVTEMRDKLISAYQEVMRMQM